LPEIARNCQIKGILNYKTIVNQASRTYNVCHFLPDKNLLLFDVGIAYGIHTYQTTIECKYWKDKVNKDIVMKVSSIIEDTGINKGIMVTKSCFTKDGLEYAKFKNIGLVEIREPTNKDNETTAKEIEFGTLDIITNIKVTGPKISKIDIGNNRLLKVKNELNLFNYFVILKNGTRVAFYDYVADFRMEVSLQNVMDKEITKNYKVPKSNLHIRLTDKILELDEINLTGQLT